MGSIISWIKDLWQFLLDEFESLRRFVLSWAGKVVLGLLGLLGVTWLLDQANKLFSKLNGKTLGISTPVSIPSQNTLSSEKVQTVGDCRHDTEIAGTQDKFSPVPSQDDLKLWNNKEQERAKRFMCELDKDIEKYPSGYSKVAGIRWFSVNTVDGTKRYLMLQTEYVPAETGYLQELNPSVCWWQDSFDLDSVLEVLKVKENLVPENQGGLQQFWHELVDQFIAKDRQEEFKNTCPAVLFFRIQEGESLSLLPYNRGKKGKETLAIEDKEMECWIHPPRNIVSVVTKTIQLENDKVGDISNLTIEKLAHLLFDYAAEASKKCNSFSKATLQLELKVSDINLQTMERGKEKRMKVGGSLESAAKTENSVHIPNHFPNNPMKILTFQNMWNWLLKGKENLSQANKDKIDRFATRKAHIKRTYNHLVETSTHYTF